MLFADQPLARRLEEADSWGGVECARAHVGLYPGSGAASEPVAGGYAIFAGVGSPLTHALGLGMSGPVSEAEVERMEAFFRSRDAPANIEMCPLADATLLKLLRKRGYRIAGFSSVLVRPLSRRESFPPLNSGVRVRRASPTEVELWVSTVAQSFHHEERVLPAATEIFSTLFHMANATCFLGWVDGEPAGGGAVAIHKGVAMLFGTGTRPAFRKRGVQAALIYSRLALAAVSGCDLAMVTTPPGSVSQRNVERQGFRVVYTRSQTLLDWTS